MKTSTLLSLNAGTGTYTTPNSVHVFQPSYVHNSLSADLGACGHVIEVKILTELRAMLSNQTLFRMFLTLVETDFLLNLLLLCRHVQFVM